MRSTSTQARGPLDWLTQWFAPQKQGQTDLIEEALGLILRALVGNQPAYTPPPPKPVRAGTTGAGERAQIRAAVKARDLPTTPKPPPVPDDPLARAIDAVARRVLRVGWGRERTPQAQEQRIQRTLKEHGVRDPVTRELAAAQIRRALDAWCRNHYGEDEHGRPNPMPNRYDRTWREDFQADGGWQRWAECEHHNWQRDRAYALRSQILGARARGGQIGQPQEPRHAPARGPGRGRGSGQGPGPGPPGRGI